MNLHDVPKEVFEPQLPEELQGLKNYLYETNSTQIRIHADFSVEFDYDRTGHWRRFPPSDIPGWRTYFSQHNNKPWPWDRIEFVP